VAERGAQLSDGQFGSRKRQSAVDAVAITVDRAHTACIVGTIPGILQMDINAPFPCVVRGGLIHKMRGKGTDGDLI